MSNQTLFIMKKKLLYLTFILLFSVSTINAQTKVWEFKDAAIWPLSNPITPPATAQESNYLTETVVDKLGIFPGPSTVKNFGVINLNNGTFTDAYTSTTRFQVNGNGGVTGTTYLPVQRYLYVTVDGPCLVKVWFRHASSTAGSADRSVLVTDGTSLVGSAAAPVSGSAIVSANYTNVGGGKLYIYSDNGVNLFKIEVTGANVTTPALSTKDFQKELDVTVFAKDGKIFLSNIKTSTKVNVYNVLGALVKTAQLDADSSLDVNGGVYIVNAKSAEGEKSVKVIVP